MLAPGASVDRYELVCPIGEGGMAQVWIARQRGKHGFEKLFALKSIHPRYADDPAFRAMFLDEARIAAAIQHPNVAQVFDLGEDGSQLYLVMELVDGESLSSLMASAAKREGKRTPTTVPIAIALRVIADVCAGLHAAHRLTDKAGKIRGVVHRDVSPHNILLGVRGDVKLIDFGIALAADRTSGDTGASSLKGKINYMAPEQALKRPVGPYTDVFGAGATLYRMLAARTPFDGGSEAGTLSNLMSNVAPAPLPEGVPPLVAAIVERALARDPGDRYASAQEMANAIEGAIVEEGLVPDVATWVRTNLSDRARARRAELDASSVFPEKIEALPPAADIGAPRISQPPENTKTPGFIDVRALVAQGPRPVPRDDDEALPVEGGGVPKRGRDLDDDGAPVKRPSFAPAAIGVGKAKKKRRPAVVVLAIAGASVLALGGVLAIAAPRIVRSRAIADARAAGIDLDVGVAAVGFSGVTLNDVTAKIPSIPAVERVHIDRIEVVGFSGNEVRISNADATIDGPLAAVAGKLLAFADQNRRRIAGTSAEPHKYILETGRFTWKNAFGEGTVISAGEANGELDSRGAGVEEVHAAIARFDITTPKTIIGPWAFSWERNAQSARARVMFDPAVMDGPSALVVWGAADSRTLTVRIPRSPLANLGIRPNELGLPADTATELEAKVDATRDGAGKIDGKGKIDVWAARLSGWNGPTDIHLDGGVTGIAGKPLDFDKTTQLRVGPFVMAVAGTLEPRDDGVRVDATWRTQPIACEKLVHAEAVKMGPIVEAIQDLAHKTGAARVTGAANAAGVLRWDSQAPRELAVTFTTKETCGLSLFGL